MMRKFETVFLENLEFDISLNKILLSFNSGKVRIK